MVAPKMTVPPDADNSQPAAQVAGVSVRNGAAKMFLEDMAAIYCIIGPEDIAVE